MTMNLARAVAAAWAMFRRDREVMIALAGLFLFVPALALLLLVAAPPVPVAANDGQAAVEAWLRLYAAWLVANAPGMLAAAAASLFGALTITVFVMDGSRPSVAEAMSRALRLFPLYAGLAAAVMIGASLGMLALVIPGLWIAGRAMLIAPALAAEGVQSPGPLIRSVRLTRGNGLLVAGLAGIGLFGAQLVATPLLALDDSLRTGVPNPIAITLVDALIAAIEASLALGMILLRVTLYWQTTGRSAR